LSGYVPPEPSADQCAYTPRFLLGSSPAFRDFTHRLWKVRDFRAVLLLQGEPGSPFELLARELAGISVFREGPVMFCPADQFQPRALIQALAPSLLSTDAATLIVTGVESFSEAQQQTLEQLITGRDVFLPFARRFRLLLSATDQLSERVDEGTFQETLFYKVSAITVMVPSLRQMRSDIPANVQSILDQLRSETQGKTPAILSPGASTMLVSMPWRGNYAELYNCVRQAAMRCTGDTLDVDVLSPDNRIIAPPESTPTPPVVAGEVATGT
jgi:DNA-binding NtrC family response regulator